MNKPSIFLFGLFHLWEQETYFLNENNELRQSVNKEMDNLIQLLSEYKPNKIAVTWLKEEQNSLNNMYHNYLIKGNITEDRISEITHIALPLAKYLNQEMVYAVDWGGIESNWGFGLLLDWAKENDRNRYDNIIQKLDGLSIDFNDSKFIDIVERLNNHQFIKKNHSIYLELAALQNNGEYMGVEWLTSWWYKRNLIIYSNLVNIIENNDDRILFIVGSGHVHLLKQLLEDNEEIDVKTLQPSMKI